MVSRTRSRDDAQRLGRELDARVRAELREGRLDRNLSGAAVGSALGMSASQYSRLERGLTKGLTFEQGVIALDAVGLRLTIGIYPGGPPLRDAGHAALIERLRARCNRSIRVLTEVPMPESRDLRAWDVVLAGVSWRHPLEVETRPRDRQALERRMALKLRDSGLGAMSLVLLDSRHNRDFARLHAAALAERFPVPAAVALAALAEGRDPGAGSVILL